ncbi:mechanosensitive ion channel MscS [Halorubrum saccharovorum DSM 1137]|uniref:Mechanosensitive ion channel MscS n=1 Tax=Halorubrum saccharovorum DSM 1137 TaxID=1227484 RepID=M0E9P0_9EURY|nr:mechanosensitive ion channel family protein [Halorubrum saccharovorum]ELZ43124.1 mechanosensitive ion channel MscS [Halorubrum saccharovorum DSM 1137]
MAASQIGTELVPKYVGLLAQIAEFLLVTGAAYLLGTYVVRPAVGWVFDRRELEPTLERTVEKLIGVGTVVGALVVGAWAAGFTGFLGGSALIVAALTLAVGFAAQDVLSNFVAGVFIVQDRNFNIDDWIEWNGNAGFIDDIGFRVTRVRTFDNETITVPNTEIATNAVTNRMSNDTLRISTTFGIGYGDDIDETTRILLDAAADHDDIVADPEPSVRVAGLADTAIDLQARFWIADPDREEFSVTRSEYIRTVTERCRAAGIDLSTTSQHAITGDLRVEDADGA